MKLEIYIIIFLVNSVIANYITCFDCDDYDCDGDIIPGINNCNPNKYQNIECNIFGQNCDRLYTGKGCAKSKEIEEIQICLKKYKNKKNGDILCYDCAGKSNNPRDCGYYSNLCKKEGNFKNQNINKFM